MQIQKLILFLLFKTRAHQKKHVVPLDYVTHLVGMNCSPGEIWSSLMIIIEPARLYIQTQIVYIYIYIKVNNVSLKSLCDTGASRNCMNEQTAQRLRLKIQPLDDNDCDCLFGANGDPIEILGTVSMDVNINGLRMPTTFQILKILSHSIILSMEFLEQNKAVIDTHRGIVTFHEITGTPFSRKRPDNMAYARAVRSVIIPLLNETIVDVRIDKHYSLQQPSIIEPVDRLIIKRVMLAKCIVTPKSYVVQCRMLNPSPATVFFKRDYIFGTTEPFGDQRHDINVLDSHQSLRQLASSFNKTKNNLT